MKDMRNARIDVGDTVVVKRNTHLVEGEVLKVTRTAVTYVVTLVPEHWGQDVARWMVGQKFQCQSSHNVVVVGRELLSPEQIESSAEKLAAIISPDPRDGLPLTARPA